MRWGSALLVLAAVAQQTARAQETGAVSFTADVRPILMAHCAGCHQPAKAEGRLDVTSYAKLLAGGDTVVAGDLDASVLIQVVTAYDGEEPEMPKGKPALAAADVRVLERWIAAGAVDDTPPALAARGAPEVYERLPVVTSIDVSPDGRWVAVAGSSEVLLHRYEGGLEARLEGLAERIESVAFSPDGARLAVVGGSPARFGEVQVWDVAERGLELSVQVTFDTLRGVSWSPDGTRLAFGCADRSLRAIDARSGEQVLFQGAHEDWVLDTTWSTDASHLVSVSRDRSMKLVKVATSQFIDNITSITPGALKGGLAAVARHPVKDELLACGADGVPRLYRMYREKKRVIGDDYNLLRAYAGLDGRLCDARWLPGEEAFVVSSSRSGAGEVRKYGADAEAPVWTYAADGGVYALACHPAGDRVLCAGQSGLLIELDAATGRPLRELVPVPLQEETTE